MSISVLRITHMSTGKAAAQMVRGNRETGYPTAGFKVHTRILVSLTRIAKRDWHFQSSLFYFKHILVRVART